MLRAIVLASFVVSILACSSRTDVVPGDSDVSSASTSCVDFAATDAEMQCTTSTDCTWFDETHVCPGDPSCGGQNPINKTGFARFAQETGAIERTPVSCGVARASGCQAGRCVLCDGPSGC